MGRSRSRFAKPEAKANRNRSRRASNKGYLSLGFEDYLRILDWTGRQARSDKRGMIPHELRPILDRLGVRGESWVDCVENFGRWFHREAGRVTQHRAGRSQAESLDKTATRGRDLHGPDVTAPAALENTNLTVPLPLAHPELVGAVRSPPVLDWIQPACAVHANRFAPFHQAVPNAVLKHAQSKCRRDLRDIAPELAKFLECIRFTGALPFRISPATSGESRCRHPARVWRRSPGRAALPGVDAQHCQ